MLKPQPFKHFLLAEHAKATDFASRHRRKPVIHSFRKMPKARASLVSFALTWHSTMQEKRGDILQSFVKRHILEARTGRSIR